MPPCPCSRPRGGEAWCSRQKGKEFGWFRLFVLLKDLTMRPPGFLRAWPTDDGAAPRALKSRRFVMYHVEARFTC